MHGKFRIKEGLTAWMYMVVKEQTGRVLHVQAFKSLLARCLEHTDITLCIVYCTPLSCHRRLGHKHAHAHTPSPPPYTHARKFAHTSATPSFGESL